MGISSILYVHVYFYYSFICTIFLICVIIVANCVEEFLQNTVYLVNIVFEWNWFKLRLRCANWACELFFSCCSLTRSNILICVPPIKEVLTYIWYIHTVLTLTVSDTMVWAWVWPCGVFWVSAWAGMHQAPWPFVWLSATNRWSCITRCLSSATCWGNVSNWA